MARARAIFSALRNHNSSQAACAEAEHVRQVIRAFIGIERRARMTVNAVAEAWRAGSWPECPNPVKRRLSLSLRQDGDWLALALSGRFRPARNILEEAVHW